MPQDFDSWQFLRSIESFDDAIRISVLPDAEEGNLLFLVSVDKGQSIASVLAQSLKAKFEDAIRQASYPVQVLESMFPEVANIAA